MTEFKKFNYHELKELFDSPGGKQKITRHIQECYGIINEQKSDINKMQRELFEKSSKIDGLEIKIDSLEIPDRRFE